MTRDLKNEVYDLDKVLARTIQLLEADPTITAENKQTINEFVEDGKSRGLSLNRLVIYLQNMRRLGKLTSTSFKAFEQKDAKELMKTLESRNYGVWTKNMSKGIFKLLMRTLQRPADVYNWMRIGHPPSKLKSEDLLTENDISKVVAVAPGLMWKTLISCLAEGGMRPGELLTLKVGNVKINSNHVKIYASGKMAAVSGERALFFFKTYDLLVEYISQHADKDKSDAPLWVTQHQKPVTLEFLGRMIKRLGARAKLGKNINPYLFRHSFATANVKKHGAALAARMLGHTGLKTIQGYMHLCETDILDALQEEHGLKPKVELEQTDSELCQCGHKNSYGAWRCAKCGSGLGATGQSLVETEKETELKAFQEDMVEWINPETQAIFAALKNPEVLAALKKAVVLSRSAE